MQICSTLIKLQIQVIEKKIKSPSFCQGLGYVSALQFLQLSVLKKWSQSVPWVLDRWSDVKIYIIYDLDCSLVNSERTCVKGGGNTGREDVHSVTAATFLSAQKQGHQIDPADQQTWCPVTQQKTTFKTSDATQCHTATQNNTGTPSQVLSMLGTT